VVNGVAPVEEEGEEEEEEDDESSDPDIEEEIEASTQQDGPGTSSFPLLSHSIFCFSFWSNSL